MFLETSRVTGDENENTDDDGSQYRSIVNQMKRTKLVRKASIGRVDMSFAKKD